MITIFTDGPSRGNPGPGGWAAVIVSKQENPKERGSADAGAYVIELGGAEKMTTNNRMELKAAAGALKKVRGLHGTLKERPQVVLYSDSSYVINGITKWIHGWKRNGWQTQTKEDVQNKDLWMELAEESGDSHIQWKYVGGHVGIVGNERCDHIATEFADGVKLKLYEGPLSGYDLPRILDIQLDEKKLNAKKSDSAHARAKAFSYVSAVGGVIETHHSWADCEKRVKGARGAKYRKAISAEDEQKIIAEFEAL